MNHITTPIGNLLSRTLIQRVSHVPGRGVVLLDGYGRMLEFIRVENDVLAIRVRDLVNQVVFDGRRAKQPDWSFLTDASVDAE